MPTNYRALTIRTASPSSGGGFLHLIRDDNEASLCGLPRSTLGPGSVLDQLVCPNCIEWLPKRMDSSESPSARQTGSVSRSHSPRDTQTKEQPLSINWDDDHKYVYAEWNGMVESAEFRSGTLEILKAIRDRHAASLISDNRRLEAIANQDQLWINESWVPMAVASGLRRIAVVLAPSGLGKVGSEGIISRFEDKVFETRTFESVDDATRWVTDTKP